MTSAHSESYKSKRQSGLIDSIALKSLKEENLAMKAKIKTLELEF